MSDTLESATTPRVADVRPGPALWRAAGVLAIAHVGARLRRASPCNAPTQPRRAASPTTDELSPRAAWVAS